MKEYEVWYGTQIIDYVWEATERKALNLARRLWKRGALGEVTVKAR